MSTFFWQGTIFENKNVKTLSDTECPRGFDEIERSREMPVETFLSWVETCKTFLYTKTKKKWSSVSLSTKFLKKAIDVSSPRKRFRFFSFKFCLTSRSTPNAPEKLFIRLAYALLHSESIEKEFKPSTFSSDWRCGSIWNVETPLKRGLLEK